MAHVADANGSSRCDILNERNSSKRFVPINGQSCFALEHNI